MMGINLISTYYIIKKENTRPRFLQWYTAHRKVASGFIILAGIDISVLNVLHSNIASSSFFIAPFSDNAKSKIFWGEYLYVFIGEIPQLIIQVRI